MHRWRQMSLLLACPRDVRRLILSWLDARSLLHFAETCAAARAMAAEPHLWRLLCLSGHERAAQRRMERESHRDWKSYYIWTRQANGLVSFDDFTTAQAESKRNLEAGLRMLGHPAKDHHARRFLETAFRYNPTKDMFDKLLKLVPDLTMQHGYWEHLMRQKAAREKLEKDKRADDMLETVVNSFLRESMFDEARATLEAAFQRHPDVKMAKRILRLDPLYDMPGNYCWAEVRRRLRDVQHQ